MATLKELRDNLEESNVICKNINEKYNRAFDAEYKARLQHSDVLNHCEKLKQYAYELKIELEEADLNVFHDECVLEEYIDNLKHKRKKAIIDLWNEQVVDVFFSDNNINTAIVKTKSGFISEVLFVDDFTQFEMVFSTGFLFN